MQVEDGRKRGEGEVPKSEQGKAGRQDQLIEKTRAPKAAKEEKSGGRSGDCGGRLERNVQRGSAIGEIEARNEDERQRRAGRAERATNRKPPEPQHDISPSLTSSGEGPVFWAGPDCHFGYACSGHAEHSTAVGKLPADRPT